MKLKQSLLALVAAMIVGTASAQNLGFETGDTTSWSSSSLTATGSQTVQAGSNTWVINPYGTSMGTLQIQSGTFSDMTTALGLSQTSVTGITTMLQTQAQTGGGNPTPTTAGWTTRTVTLTAGTTFSLAWQYVSVDYMPYNDGSITTLTKTGSTATTTVNNYTSQYALLGFTNTGTGDYSTGSYGATGWQVSTYSVSESGDYLLGFGVFNLGDTALSPILYIDEVQGTTTKNGTTFGAVAPNNATAPSATTPPATPTVTGSTTTNTVTNSTSYGTSSSTSSTAYGTSTATATEVNGTPVSVTTESRARSSQTIKVLNVSQTFTTVVTTPVAITTVTRTPYTITTVTTTPVTVTTTTTPVTVTTYSDNTSATTTGTPVVTTTVGQQQVTTTQTGTQEVTTLSSRNDVDTSAVTNNYSTRIDQLNKLLRANGNTNTLLDSAVTDRVSIDGNHFVGLDGPQGYVILDANRSNTADSYYMKAQRMGVGFDYRYDAETIVGAQYNRHVNNLHGNNAGGKLTKDHFGIYSLHNVNGWLVKNDLAYAFNRYETHHSIPELGYANQARTKGADFWFASRLYTPDVYGFRPFAGVRWEHGYGKAVTETGSAMTAMSYTGFNDMVRNEEVGVSFEQKLTDDFTVKSEVNRTTLNYSAASLAVSYQVEKTTSVDFKVGQQRWDDVQNNTVQLNAKFLF